MPSPLPLSYSSLLLDTSMQQKFTELDCIVFKDPQQVQLLSLLSEIDKNFIKSNHVKTGNSYTSALEDKRPFAYKTSASVSGATGEGTVKLHLFARSDLFKEPGTATHYSSLSTSIIGCWYGIFPFRLSDLYPHHLSTISKKVRKWARNPFVSSLTCASVPLLTAPLFALFAKISVCQ